MIVPLDFIDIAILIVAFGSAVVIGLLFRGQNTSIDAYLLGNRNLPWWAILGSIVATETSTATVLSVPGHGYGDTGLRFLQLALGFILGRILVVVFLLPGFFDGKLLSAYEVLGRRFGTYTKRTASILFLVTRNMGDGLRLFLAAMVLEKIAGWPLVWSAIVVGGVTILYTYFGGMRSVVWNDCVQFVIYNIGGIAAVFVIVANLPDGWTSFFEFAHDRNKWTMIDGTFSLSNPFNLWAGVIGGAALSLGSHGTDQLMVQRYLSARSQRDAGRAILWSGIIVFAQFALFLLIGMLLACFYSNQETMPILRNDEVFTHFMLHSFPRNTGLIGLMLAAILAAAMSTLSSSLSASASAVVGDWWLPNYETPPSEKFQVVVTRWLTFAFGILQIGIGIWASTFDKSVVENALTIAGFSAGILLGVFALGIASEKTSDLSAFAAALAGLTVLLIVQFVLPMWGWKVAFPWLPVIGALTTFGSGFAFSNLRSTDSKGKYK
ncbi:MAG: sodium:solute symporter [Pirellulaceae bacterium]|nr:sodium:solute symporter [Pirellulaceae bacterium]